MQIAATVNLQIESIEPSLIALSRAQAHLKTACQDACLIVQLDEDVAELGICHRGRLLLDYRPGGHINGENVADVVAQHLSRLQRYVRRYHSYLDAPIRHVYLAGDADAVACARQKFGDLPNFDVHVFEPVDLDMPWKHVAQVPGTDLAAALGTAMALYSGIDRAARAKLDRTRAGPPPGADAADPDSLRDPVRGGDPTGRGAIRIPTPAVARDSFSYKPSSKPGAGLCPRHRAATEAGLGRVQARRAPIALEKQLPQPNWQQIFSHISQSMPDDVWLDRLSVRDGLSASLAGASYTDEGVYDFVGYLKQVPDVAEIALEGTGVGQSADRPDHQFHTAAHIGKRCGS